jgi:hypothetical protein
VGLPGTTERPNNRCGQRVTFSGFTHATFCAHSVHLVACHDGACAHSNVVVDCDAVRIAETSSRHICMLVDGS